MTSTASQGQNGRDLDQDTAESTKPEIADDDSSDAVMGAEEEEEDNQQRMLEMMKTNDHERNENEDTTYISTSNVAEAAQLVEEDSLPPEPQTGVPRSEASSVSIPDDTPSLKVSSTHREYLLEFIG